ncbi:MAG: Petrobactin biosynthesis protein AsbE [Brevibacillus sp.]|nr:Petrobactin biosynthesis protein AsbE [Brevibacillus sp.]
MVNIKVHCLISCFCEIVKRRSRVDYRPYYFGIWDAPFDVTEEGVITYFTDDICHDFYRDWYERFFGLKVHQWYDPAKDRRTNLQILRKLLDERPEHRYIIVHLDMSLIPERENRFNQKPFPHYVILSKTENDAEWFMLDADMRWEGNLPKEHVTEAILGNLHGGGFYIDAAAIKEPSWPVIERYFRETFRRDENELTARVREVVSDMAEGRRGRRLSMLMTAVKQLNILAIRKYSYDYALLYFRDYLPLSQEHYDYWAQQIRDLVQGFHTIRYLAIKTALTENREFLRQLLGQIDQVDQLEKNLKQEIERQFRMWTDVVRERENRKGVKM